MGAWGAKIFQDDTTSDIKDDYIKYLKCSLTDEDAEKKVLDTHGKECIGTDEESIFWYALASVEHKYGRLSESVKSKALYFIDHPELDENLELFKEESIKIYEQRKLVLSDLKTILLGESLPYKKVSQYKNKYSKFKVGDVLAIKYDLKHFTSDQWHCHSYFLNDESINLLKNTVEDKYFIIVIVNIDRVTAWFHPDYFTENEQFICLDWKSDKFPTKDELLELPFVKSDYYSQDNIMMLFYQFNENRNNNIKRYKTQYLFNICDNNVIKYFNEIILSVLQMDDDRFNSQIVNSFDYDVLLAIKMYLNIKFDLNKLFPLYENKIYEKSEAAKFIEENIWKKNIKNLSTKL